MIVDEKGIKDSWKEYVEKMTNEGSEWDHIIWATVKEGPAKEKKQKECASDLNDPGCQNEAF